MSILASCHLPEGAWAFDVQPESPSPNIEIGFTCDHLPVQFDNLQFGFKVFANGVEALAKSYPPEGACYVSSDQQYMTNDQVFLAADDEVVLDVWMINSGNRHEASIPFIVPRPAQPFPSWTWEDGEWTPPVPCPDGIWHVWDEGNQTWNEIEPVFEEGDVCEIL